MTDFQADYQDTRAYAVGGGCNGSLKEKENTAQTRKVRVTASSFNLGIVFQEIGGSTVGLKRESPSANYQRDPNGSVANTTNYSSSGSSGTCNFDPEGDTDTDGHVRTQREQFGAIFGTAIPETVVSTGTYAGLAACATHTASWNDTLCP